MFPRKLARITQIPISPRTIPPVRGTIGPIILLIVAPEAFAKRRPNMSTQAFDLYLMFFDVGMYKTSLAG